MSHHVNIPRGTWVKMAAGGNELSQMSCEDFGEFKVI